MHRHLKRLAGALAWGIVLTSVVHAQATIDDCEKIQAADAYNQCLAKFGPTSKLKNLEPGRPSDFKSGSDEAAATAAPKARAHTKTTRHAAHRRGRSHGSHRASRGGRKRMVISVGKGRRRHR